ncbi:hypothetical protein OH77DRAFT_1426656 [Trametes cingulata]|nr:hypothetical protein OH77DRAFT_1426656 [Trametes cingulata]
MFDLDTRALICYVDRSCSAKLQAKNKALQRAMHEPALFGHKSVFAMWPAVPTSTHSSCRAHVLGILIQPINQVTGLSSTPSPLRVTHPPCPAASHQDARSPHLDSLRSRTGAPSPYPRKQRDISSHHQAEAMTGAEPAPARWPMNHARETHTVDPRRPWVPSPSLRAVELHAGHLPGGEAQSSRSASTRSSRASGRKLRTRRQAGDEGAPVTLTLTLGGSERPQSWLSCLHPKKLFRRSRSLALEEGATLGSPEGRPGRREISPAEWRAYGYWARPRLGGTWGFTVNNATPPDIPRELSPPEVDAMIASLREPGGATFPENWVGRVQHPALPPRPDLWPTPRQRYDPLPGEVQLNPWLVHRITGPPPLHFDLRLRAADVKLNIPSADGNRVERVEFDCDGPNGSQPATYPGVPRLRICALAGDSQPTFWWPVTVLPHHEALPVQVCDVLDALIANFEERMTADEFRQLSEERVQMLCRAYARRTALVVGGRTCPRDDGLRRVDYLGDSVCFRGLEPAPDGEGFMLFVGPPP